MKKPYKILCASILTVACVALPIQASLIYGVAGSTYSQNFSSLPDDNNTNYGWTNSVTLPGWYLADGSGSTPATYRSANTGGISDTAHYLVRNVTPKAWGARTTSVYGDAYMGIAFENDTGGTLTSFDLSFDAVQAYDSTANQQMRAYYSTDATSLTSGNWTLMSSLTYTAPVSTAGNSSMTNTEVEDTREALAIAGQSVNWLDGETLWVRWVSYRDLDGEYSASASVLGVSDVEFSAIPEPSSMLLVLLGTGAIAFYRRRIAR